MKLKSSIFLTLIFLISVNVFGQKTETVNSETKKVEEKTPAVVKLPSVKEILDKYVQAIGGREANEKIKTRLMKSTIEFPAMGIKGTGETYQSAPNKIYSKAILGGIGEIIEAFDGTTAWSVNPIQGNRTKSGEELLQTKLTADFYREINLDKLYPKMEVKGIEKIGDKEAYIVSATPNGLPAETFYFDTKTGFLLRSDSTVISPEGKMPTKVFFDDIREIDGIKLPYKIRTVLPQFEIIATISEIKHGVVIEDKLFVKP